MNVVVFDFDGVIIPSEGIKQHAYEWIFSEFGEAVPHEAIRQSREEFSNARGNRYDIIRGIFRRLGETNIEEKVREYSERFSTIVKQRINDLSVEPKVLGMLEKLSKKHSLYINSNNPDEPLRETLEALGIARFFKGVYGSSASKTENLRTIATQEQAAARDIVFIGDGDGDRFAAREYGCVFVGVATELNGWKDGTMEFKIIQSVAEFDRTADRGGERMV